MITNTQRDLLLEQYYATGVERKEIRNYEVSLWTLQDSFITILKWSDIEQKGRIQDPKMKLNINGTEEFTFSIPMYIRQNGVLVENPNWYNTRNGNLLANMRKVKVVFNKNDRTKKAVFEFMIINVSEVHQDDILTCEVSCEGLAFHELGKIGYRYSLTPDIYTTDVEEWAKTMIGTQPMNNLDYWCDKISIPKLHNNEVPANSRTWYYRVQMDWSAFQNTYERSQEIIYEEGFATAWDDNLVPTTIEAYREKYRSIDITNSNLYNITQKIAETFGVFCRYDYLHDDNNAITGRIITFYNNFFAESNGILSLTYPYNLGKVTRQVDTSNLTTKLYVSDVDAQDILEGQYSIMNTDANISHEPYILNFDYLYECGAIEKEQYEGIAPFIKTIRQLNEELTVLQNNYSYYETKIPEVEARKKILEQSTVTDKDLITQNSQLRQKLSDTYGDGDGYIEVKVTNPDQRVIIPDTTQGNYINLDAENKGIVANTIHVYTSFSPAQEPYVSDEITDFTITTDDYGNAIKLVGIPYSVNHNIVYLTYKYNPILYYDTIIEMWQIKLNSDTAELQAVEKELEEKIDGVVVGGLYMLRDNTYDAIQAKLDEKEQALKAFERLMGPAIREGYWTPEDYTNRGESHSFSSTIPTAKQGIISEASGSDMLIDWDTEQFEDENDIYFLRGINENKVAYPCINISSILPTLTEPLTKYSVVWNNNIFEENSDNNDIRNLTIYSIGLDTLSASAKFSYVEANGTILPVLVLEGAKNLSDQMLNHLYTFTQSRPRLCIIDTSVTEGVVTVQIIDSHDLSNMGLWLPRDMTTSSYNAAFLRIKCSSIGLITDPTSLLISYNNVLLNPYNDYYVLNRSTARQGSYYIEYFITIKPHIFALLGIDKTIKVNYLISNASTAIYLDAKKIAKENAWPKISYELSPTVLRTDFSELLYNQLATIVMINDTDLKFEEQYGYISELSLDLDDITKDQVTIQNYTSKFEDLFSSIMAATESLTKASGLLNALSNGNISLSASSVSSLFNENTSIIDAYLDAHFDTSAVIQQRLEALFTEASAILGDSNKALNKMRGLTLENASILAGFAANIAQELSGQVFKQDTQPTSFKVGDVWIQTENGNEIARYVATSNSADSANGYGFVRTNDGSLAQITGAGLDIDAAAGAISLKAANSIDIASGCTVNIGANENVNITGNKAVNIGGTQINIGSVSVPQVNGSNVDVYGGINLVATSYDSVSSLANSTQLSKVLISPTQIELGGSNILMRGTNLIQMVTSRGSSNNTSAIELSPETGVWIGSGQGIRLFSGGFSYDATTNVLSKTAASGASVELNSSHLILGYSNTTNNNGSAIELDENKIVLATGSAAIGDLNITGTDSGLIGAKFTKDSIGFATGSSNNISAILMNGTQGITLGAGSINITQSTSALRSAGGSYVRIAPTGIDIGSTANLYINTSNFKLQTNPTGNDPNLGANTILAIGTDLNGITSETAISGLPSNSGVTFLITKNAAYVKGTLYADTLYIGGKKAKISLDNKGLIELSSLQSVNLSSYNFDELSGSNVSITPTSITLTTGGTLKLDGGTIDLSAADISLGSQKIPSSNLDVTIPDAYTRVTNIDINTQGITMTGPSISMTGGNLTMTSGNLNITSGNIQMSGGDIAIDAGHRLTINGRDVWAADNIFWATDAQATEKITELRNSGYHGQFIWIKPDAGTVASYGSADNTYCDSGTWLARNIASGTNPLTAAANATYTITIHCGIGVEDTNSDADNGSATRRMYISANANGSSSIELSTTRAVYLSRYDANYRTAVADYYTTAAGSNATVRSIISANTIYCTPVDCDYAWNIEITITATSGEGAASGTLCTVYYYSQVPEA